jgi:hypothetical protein
LKEGTGVTSKGTKEMVTGTSQKVIILFTWDSHIIPILIGFMVYQEILVRKCGIVTSCTPGVLALVWGSPRTGNPKFAQKTPS